MLVLLGYMGSGKSVVGQRVSDLLNYEFIDLDDYIELKENKTISKIFSEKGAIYFRNRENYYLKNIIKENKKVVLSLGGGTPCYFDHMKLLNSKEGIKSFYLNAGITNLTNRLWNNRSTRPLISNVNDKTELVEFIGKHLFERRPFYQMADHQINVDDKSLEQISTEIINVLL